MTMPKPLDNAELRECLCQVCNAEYPVWYAPNELWNKVMRPDGEASEKYAFICPSCFAREAESIGVVTTGWLFTTDEQHEALLARREAEAREPVLEALEEMVMQFGYKSDGDDKRPPSIFTGGLSALEGAFSVLGWPHLKPYPEGACAVEDCQNWVTCGTPQKEGPYLSCCGEHYSLAQLGATFTLKPERLAALNQHTPKEG